MVRNFYKGLGVFLFLFSPSKIRIKYLSFRFLTSLSYCVTTGNIRELFIIYLHHYLGLYKFIGINIYVLIRNETK